MAVVQQAPGAFTDYRLGVLAWGGIGNATTIFNQMVMRVVKTGRRWRGWGLQPRPKECDKALTKKERMC